MTRMKGVISMGGMMIGDDVSMEGHMELVQRCVVRIMRVSSQGTTIG